MEYGLSRSAHHQQLVLLTGAEGRIGSGFREEYLGKYRDSYPLRLGVHDPDFRDERFEEVAVFDLDDAERIEAMLRGVDTVIHLAANADQDATFEDLLSPNLIGAYNVFEAARQANCRRLIFASSCHAVLGYAPGFQVRETDPARPDRLYGATKAFGEALCSVFAHRFRLSCIAIRIGAYVVQDQLHEMGEARSPYADVAVTQRDLAQLIHLCVCAPSDLTYAVFHGISNNKCRRMDIEHAKRLLGYEPLDDTLSLGQSQGD